MTHILDTTLPLASRRDIFRAVGRDSFRVHRACAERYTLPASVAAEARIAYRARRRAGHPINDARSIALVYLDGFVAGWRARGNADIDYPVQPGSDAWYTRQAASA
jgi:hypothetical protein